MTTSINANDLISLLGSQNQKVEQTPVTSENFLKLLQSTPEPQEENFGSVVGKKMLNLKSELGQKTAGALDTILSIVPQTIKQATYASARAAQQPENKAEQFSQQISSYFEPKIGQIFGVENTEGYKHPLGQTVSNISSDVGQTIKDYATKYGLTPTQISATLAKSGVNVPAGDITNMLGTLGLSVSELTSKGTTAAKTVIKDLGKKPLSDLEIRKIPASQMTPNGVSIGAAATTPTSTIEAMKTNASPELQAKIDEIGHENIDPVSLQTKLLEEKHGVSLASGQRSGNIHDYAEQWNSRGAHPTTLGSLFENQPKQIAEAFDKQMDVHGENLFDRSREGIGNAEIKGLVEKDKQRLANINQAYKDLTDANGGQFPIDTTTLKQNIEKELTKNYKSRHFSTEMKGDLEDFYANPTFEGYEALRSNLADEIRSAKNGKARQAAYIVRDQLENLPIFGEQGGDARAIQLKALADKARALYKERAETIKNNPAYAAAIKEAVSDKEASAGLEPLNAEKFHNKYITNGTAETVRRMLAEVGENSEAHQAMKVGELQRLKEAAGFKGNAINFNPNSLNSEIFKQDTKHKALFGPEGKENINEINFLGNKIIQPKTGTFNHSNTLAGYLQQMAGLGAETGAAFLTNGWSTPAIGAIKKGLQLRKDAQFGPKSIDPYEGLTK